MTISATTALFTGDSITDMCRRTDPSGFLGAGYVRRIAEMSVANEPGIKVINTGISGDRTTDLLARWDADVIERRPDVLTVMIGVNDTWRRYDAGLPMSADEFATNYVTLLERATAALDLRRIVLMEPFLVPITDEQASWFGEDLEAKIAVTAQVAQHFGATLVPLHAIFTERASIEGAANLIDDGVHPSAGGHDLIAQSWWSAVVPTLL